MCNTLQPLLTLFEGDSQAASLMSFFLFHWVAFTIASNLHCAPEHGQHFAALSNMLGQLYLWPSGARLLSPLNLPNYASHQLFSRSIAVIPEPHHTHTPPVFLHLLLYLCASPPCLFFFGFISVLSFIFLTTFLSFFPSPHPSLSHPLFLPLSLSVASSSLSSSLL